MARSRLNSLPPELQLEIYSHIPHTDILHLSHVSKLWRSIVLQDSRWNKWFEMIVNPEDGERASDIMARFKVLDMIPKRTIVTLCFDTKCTLCGKTTTWLFLPLLQRICPDCLDEDTHAVMSLSSALAVYDLSEKDVCDVVVLYWEETDQELKKKNILNRAKLVSRLAVKHVAIVKHGGEDALATHLQYKKDRLQKAYDKRLAEYNAATTERARLKARGDETGAAAVTLRGRQKAPQKTRPKLPAILKEEPYIPKFYQAISVMPTNFLVLDAHTGCLVAQKLVQCKMCNVIANLRYQDLSPSMLDDTTKPDFPEMMLAGLLDEHEQKVHHAREGDMCYEGCNTFFNDDYSDIGAPSRCDTCLNAEALATKADLVASGGWDD
ncbi:hypothetical protein MVEN_02273900 [Mycena venus]|uniref:F-box domain-containing protein n=1 Tax=Mycena venus TaxID=2733690 RepID=A0A8H6X5L3_9AGAR|nr:hypothetical protein MVEN_02273900 [Mycena venus]